MSEQTISAISVIDRRRIFQMHGQAVVLDGDLAAIYGVETKVLNQGVKRNAATFPDDFLFRLSAGEWTALRSQTVTLKSSRQGAHRKYLPLVFTEHGAIMAATILNSALAVAMLPDRSETTLSRPVERWDPLESTCRHASLSIL